MKKLIFYTILTTSIYANDSLFIGLNYNNINIKNETEKSSFSGYEIKLGEYIKNSRGTLTYSFNETKNEKTLKTTSFSYDIIPTLGNQRYIMPFIGINIGYIDFKEENLIKKGYNRDTISLKGLSYGGEAGVISAISKNIEFEIGYKYMKTDKSEQIIYNANNTEYKIKSINGYFVGLNYKF